MLPSFRLIVAAFLCGFVVVFVGLRHAATLHHVHASMPITAAHAASLPPGALATPPAQRLATPIVYDLRFVGSGGALAPLPVSLTPPDTGVLAPSPGSIDAALPQPLPHAEQPEPQARPGPLDDSTAEPTAASTSGPSGAPTAATELIAAEAAPAVVTGSVIPADTGPSAPEAAAAEDSESPLASEPSGVAATPATDGSAAAGESRTPVEAPLQVAVPTPKPRAAETAPRIAAKPAPKKRPRPAQRAAQDPFGFPFPN